MKYKKNNRRSRRAVVLILAVILMVMIFAFVAFAIDLGYMALVRTQLQNTADAASLAAAAYIPNDTAAASNEAKRFAGYEMAAGKNITSESVKVDFGAWDSRYRQFNTTPQPGNAVRVTVERGINKGGEVPLFFAPVLGIKTVNCSASAVAMTNPRDICFVVDLSGTMNNDTEPCWATNEIANVFNSQVAADVMQKVYNDFTFGTFPGTLEYVGQRLSGVAQDNYAYAEMTKNNGPLTQSSIASTYKISNSDSETTRKTKAYKWIIDKQIAAIMPNAKPTPNSANAASLSYWTAYLDYIIASQTITSSSPKGRPRPSNNVTLPPNQSANRMDDFSNPDHSQYPDASSGTVLGYRNRIGYRTYVQFMMDFGRDAQPVTGQYTPLSHLSANYVYHSEQTDGGTFSFPASEQPTHAARRSIIAALQIIKQRNENIGDTNECDWVSIITFDVPDNVKILHNLDYSYDLAMQDCTTLQAMGDYHTGGGTATETGLIAAKNLLTSSGRRYTDKIIVLLTDGIPNRYSSTNSDINSYIAQHPSKDFYSGSDYARNAALMQCKLMQSQKWLVYPVGVGLASDYDFMDRASRLGGTANQQGQGTRGSGNPAEYEQKLKDIFRKIITSPKARLVQ